MIKRREFLAGLGSTAAWPMVARAQQSAMPVVGNLSWGPSLRDTSFLDVNPFPFRKGLSDMGYVEGRNVIIEYRVTDQVDRLLALAAELVERRVTVIYAPQLTAAAAAKDATATIPIVFTGGGDPVRGGLVASLNRPGGNLTGVTVRSIELGPKRLELLREVVPQAALIGILSNPSGLSVVGSMSDIQAAARNVGQDIVILNVRSGKKSTPPLRLLLHAASARCWSTSARPIATDEIKSSLSPNVMRSPRSMRTLAPCRLEG